MNKTSKKTTVKIALIVLFVFLTQIYANDGIDSLSEKSYYKNTVFVGLNRSQLFANDEIGKMSFNLGYYRKKHLGKNFFLQYGLKYTDIKMEILNKDILLVMPGDMVHRDSDIYLNYDIIELNLLLEYLLEINQSLSIAPFVGMGYALFHYLFDNTMYDWGEFVYYDDTIDNIECLTGYTDGISDVVNSGLIVHGGIKLISDRLSCAITYTNHIKKIQSMGSVDYKDNWINLNAINFECGFSFN